MSRHKNITRYTYDNAAYLGWRMAMSRKRHTLTRYFSDKDYGGGEGSLKAALAFRDEVLAALVREAPDVVFTRYKEQRRDRKYPLGLRPPREKR